MRAVNVRVTPEQGWFGDLHRAIVDADGVSLQALHELRGLNDGSSVVLYEYTGDRATAERLVAEHTRAESDWQVADLGERQLMYLHSRPGALTAALLVVLDEWEVVVDWPVPFASDDTLVVTLVGDGGAINGLLDDVPEGIRVSVERTGDYRPESDRLLTDLTPRERETLRTAVDLGYYRNPRDAHYRDIADALGCNASTVGHHLRNVETKVMRALLNRTAPDLTA